MSTFMNNSASPKMAHEASGRLQEAKSDHGSSQVENTIPLKTSKMANQQPQNLARSVSDKANQTQLGRKPAPSSIEQILQQISKIAKDRPNNHSFAADTNLDSPTMKRNGTNQIGSSIRPGLDNDCRYPESQPKQDNSEMVRLKRELEVAQSRIAMMDRELSQTRITKHTIDEAIGSSSHSNLREVTEQLMNRLQHDVPQHSPHGFLDDNRSERSGACSPRPGDSFGNAWMDPSQAPLVGGPINPAEAGSGLGPWNAVMTPSSGPGAHSRFAPQPQRPASFRFDGFSNGYDQGISQGIRRAHGFGPYCRPGSAIGPFQGGWNPYPPSMGSSANVSPPMTPMSFQSMNAGHAPYHPRPIGTPLSPTAMEFSADGMLGSGPTTGNPWNAQPGPVNASGPSYMPPVEPLNYRRLLDRNMSCNWKYIVDKIVCSNDQQASIFLQQKLKIAPPEQKYELIEAIIAQAYPLMINRFGNFLIQRCFEHGTSDQVIAIANAIRGNTLALSMDAFGCHVVQKAFDVVPEDYKAIMVHELLRRIPETVIHRYACHVWQKLFELRWSDSPPQIMKYVNEALRGMWHEVALGETGSLVVQNIFENCLEEDKRPCIEEVIASIDVISHGQFGNWCIQHICEHGAPADKSRATEHVLRFATEYSTDQFASKVVEKCLKVGGSEFLDRYLDKVCEGRPDRPRMPLIDISADQYGNYLVQYVLLNADVQRREMVAQHVRKHMVSLRGSKFGSRVAMLCCNPASATRPGPPMALPVTNRFYQNSAMAMNQPGAAVPWR